MPSIYPKKQKWRFPVHLGPQRKPCIHSILSPCEENRAYLAFGFYSAYISHNTVQTASCSPLLDRVKKLTSVPIPGRDAVYMDVRMCCYFYPSAPGIISTKQDSLLCNVERIQVTQNNITQSFTCPELISSPEWCCSKITQAFFNNPQRPQKRHNKADFTVGSNEEWRIRKQEFRRLFTS